MLFSQRMGYKPVREAIQFESVDTALRNGLWNALHYNWWYKTDKSEWGIDEDVERILTHIWVDYFKKANR